MNYSNYGFAIHTRTYRKSGAPKAPAMKYRARETELVQTNRSVCAFPVCCVHAAALSFFYWSGELKNINNRPIAMHYGQQSNRKLWIVLIFMEFPSMLFQSFILIFGQFQILVNWQPHFWLNFPNITKCYNYQTFIVSSEFEMFTVNLRCWQTQ